MATRDPVGGSVWTRAPRGRREQPTLGREQIVRAAIEMLDSDGLAGLTIRGLGARLGSGATSIYWYVSNKDDLLDLVLDECWAEVDTPDEADDDWRAQADRLARSVRAVLNAHPWMTSLMGRHANVGPRSAALSDACIGMMLRAGFDADESAKAAAAISTYAFGYAATDASWRAMVEASGMSAQDLGRTIISAYDEVEDRLPNYARWHREAGPSDFEKLRDDTFDYGLERMLDGLAGRLPAPRRRRR